MFPIEISLSSLNSSDGVLIAYSVRDITERKLIEEEQNRLLEQIRQSREQLRKLAIRLSEAQEYNQRLIAAELHDRVGQNLTGLNLNLQVIQNLVPAEGFALVRRRLEDSMNLVEETTRQVRNVMAELNPPLLEEFGLGPALRFYCEKFMDRTGIQVNLSDGVFHSRFSSRQEMALFRIVQEGLNNVARHSHATHVDILMEISERFVTLSIEDNGQGFDLASLQIASSQPHWGLLNVQERAASIGGDLQIHSTPGKGTCLIIVIRKRTEND